MRIEKSTTQHRRTIDEEIWCNKDQHELELEWMMNTRAQLESSYSSKVACGGDGAKEPELFL